MTPRERIEAILTGKSADRAPFKIYEGLMPRSTCERKLRDDGMCLVSNISIASGSLLSKEYERYFASDKSGGKASSMLILNYKSLNARIRFVTPYVGKI